VKTCSGRVTVVAGRVRQNDFLCIVDYRTMHIEIHLNKNIQLAGEIMGQNSGVIIVSNSNTIQANATSNPG
jgi:hypothetical protein